MGIVYTHVFDRLVYLVEGGVHMSFVELSLAENVHKFTALSKDVNVALSITGAERTHPEDFSLVEKDASTHTLEFHHGSGGKVTLFSPEKF